MFLHILNQALYQNKLYLDQTVLQAINKTGSLYQAKNRGIILHIVE